MRQKTGPQTSAAEKAMKDIRRATRKHHSAEDKIRVVLEGLRGEAVSAIGDYIDGFDNPVLKHSALGHTSLVQFETMDRNLETEALH